MADTAPAPYTGETPFIEQAARDLGVIVAPGMVSAIRPFALLSRAVVDALHHDDATAKPAIAAAAAEHLAALAVADLAARRIVAHLHATLGLPMPRVASSWAAQLDVANDRIADLEAALAAAPKAGKAARAGG